MVGSFFFILRIICLWTCHTKYSIITSLFLLNIENFFEKVLLFVGKVSDIECNDGYGNPRFMQMKGLCHDADRRTQSVRGTKT